MENELQNESQDNEIMFDDIDGEGIPVQKKAKSKFAFLKKLNRKLTYIVIIIAAVSGVAYYYKNIFVAASVNGGFISRLSVISELEKQSGKQALDYLITQKLIDDEIKKSGIQINNEDLTKKIDGITAQVESQGSTLAAMLVSQGMTQKEFTDRISVQMKLEKILADKTSVSDTEVAQYMKDNKITVPKGTDPTETKSQIKDTIRQSKFSAAANAWVSDLRSKANIKYYINY